MKWSRLTRILFAETGQIISNFCCVVSAMLSVSPTSGDSLTSAWRTVVVSIMSAIVEVLDVYFQWIVTRPGTGITWTSRCQFGPVVFQGLASYVKSRYTSPTPLFRLGYGGKTGSCRSGGHQVKSCDLRSVIFQKSEDSQNVRGHWRNTIYFDRTWATDWRSRIYFREFIAPYNECLRHALTSKSRSCRDHLTESRGLAYSSEKITIFDEKLKQLAKFSERNQKISDICHFPWESKVANLYDLMWNDKSRSTWTIAAVRRTTSHDKCGFTKFDFIAGIRLWSQENKFHINLTVCSIRKMTGPSFVPINKLREL